MSSDTTMLTYKEAAKKLNIKADSVRRRARNRNWHRVRGNDGITLVAIPSHLLPEDVPEDITTDKVDKTDTGKDIIIAVLEAEKAMLLDANSELKKDRDAWREQALKRVRWWPF